MLGTAAATVHCRWTVTGQRSPEGRILGERGGVFTFVLEQQGDSWITVAAHNTDTIPQVQTHTNDAGTRSTAHYGPSPSVD